MTHHLSNQGYFVIHFTVLWTLATAAGWMFWVFGASFPLFWLVLWPFLLFCGSIPGITVGVFQWRLLRRYQPNAGAWLLGIMPGTIISWLAINRAANTDVVNAENGAIIGLIIGISQAIVLAHWIKWRALFWVLISIASWIISWIVFGQGFYRGFETLASATALAGVLSGLATGPALIMLLSPSVTQSQEVV